MSKHDTFKNNLLALTRSRSLEKAVDGWLVKKNVTLAARILVASCCLARRD
jgi:hypothetical protein